MPDNRLPQQSVIAEKSFQQDKHDAPENILKRIGKTGSMRKIKCWEFYSCTEKECPAYHATDLSCWLFSSTHCCEQIQGKFLEKIEMCLDCPVFNANIDTSTLKSTLKIVGSQYQAFREKIDVRDTELKDMSIELALGLSEVFDALKKIASGDPTVRIPESSEIEIIGKLKKMINRTAAEIGEIVDQSHEFAMGLAEHFDVLQRVSKGDLNAGVTGISSIELLESLKKVTNKMIESISSEIHERQQAEESIRKLEALESSILSTIPHAVVGLRNRTIIFANDSVEDVFGWKPDEIIGEKSRIFYRSDRDFELIANRFYPALEQQQTYSEEFPCRHRDGRDMICRIHASVIGNKLRDRQVVVMYADVTEQKKLEAQLMQAQKMEAIGTLAGGVAHDFNNILTAVISYGNILLMKMPENDPLRTYMERILDSSEKATSLIHSLLAFSRKQMMNSRPVNINTVLQKLELLLVRLIGEDIDLSIQLDDHELVVLADAGQIEQVMMNLATNARDAMPDIGTISIHTERVRLDNEFVKAHGYGEPGTYVLITVSDTGEGMDEKTIGRIFEPFYTTKEVGKGTGLGLAMAYGIIKQHDGYITCYSEPGRGTTFKIYLPLVNQEAEEEIISSAVNSMHKGHETILIAEDNADVRKAEKEILTESGYTVIESEDGEDAIRKFSENGNRKKIDLLIFDVIMPKKNGKEAYDAIRRKNPHIKVIFTSGYTADIIHRRGILEEGSDFVLKPFLPHRLLEKVRTILDAGCLK